MRIARTCDRAMRVPVGPITGAMKGAGGFCTINGGAYRPTRSLPRPNGRRATHSAGVETQFQPAPPAPPIDEALDPRARDLAISDAVVSGRLLRIIDLAQARAPGLSLSQFKLFIAVAGNEGLRIQELARFLGDIDANVSRNVRSMTGRDYAGSLNAAHGLLTLLRGARDSRTRHVVLSPSGRRLFAQIAAEAQTLQDRPHA